MKLTTFYVLTDLSKNQILEVSDSPEILSKKGDIFTCRAKNKNDAMCQIAKARMLAPHKDCLAALGPN